jgi:hypothetical protein
MTYRAPDLGDYAFHRTRGGRASPRCPVHESTRLVLESRGYRRRGLSLADLMASDPVEGRRRVEIERGVLRTLRVVAADEDGALAAVRGARVLAGARLLGSTDADGRFVVDLMEWPENGLTVDAGARGTATWLPSDGFADLVPAQVELDG